QPTTRHGIGVASGVAAGSALFLRGEHDGPVPDEGSDAGEGGAGIERALDAVALELNALADRLRDQGHSDEAEIVAVGAIIAEDPLLRTEALDAVNAGRSPVQAVLDVTDRHARSLESLRDPMLRERAADNRQVGRRDVAG